MDNKEIKNKDLEKVQGGAKVEFEQPIQAAAGAMIDEIDEAEQFWQGDHYIR